MVKVYVPDRLLDEKEVRELCIRLNKNVGGQFDFEMLGDEYDPRDLVALGFSEEELDLGEPEPEEDKGSAEPGEGDEADYDRIIKCPKCKREFSVLEKKKKKK